MTNVPFSKAPNQGRTKAKGSFVWAVERICTFTTIHFLYILRKGPAHIVQRPTGKTPGAPDGQSATAPNPQLLPGRRRINSCALLRVCVHVCVCSLLCVCTWMSKCRARIPSMGQPYLAVCHFNFQFIT